jgi:hypothetical protein
MNIANTLPSPYPEQDGATDNENAFTGGVFLADGSTAAIRNSKVDRNSVIVNTPLGQAFGADAALCACGNVPLSLQNSLIEGNSVTVNALSSDANGPSGGALSNDPGRRGFIRPVHGGHLGRHRETLRSISRAARRAVPAPGPVPAIGAGVDTGGGPCGHAVSVSSSTRAARVRG